MRKLIPVVCAALALAGSARADDEANVVGKSTSGDASLIRRAAPGKPWDLIKEGQALKTDNLIVGLPLASMELKSGVQLKFLTDFNNDAPYPVIECAIIIHNTPKFDADFTLDRGGIDVINPKKEPVKVRVRVRDKRFDFTLEKETTLCLELYGRWAPGVRFNPKPKPDEDYEPNANLIILVKTGEAHITYEDHERLLTAPPGPALVMWDSVHGMDKSPTRLEELPKWAQPLNLKDPLVAIRVALLKEFRDTVMAKGVEQTLTEFASSDNALQRRLAVVGMAALDDLPHLAATLQQAKYPDLWENGVRALRHWVGRGPGQDLALYNRMLEAKKMPPEEVATVMELLHSFGEDDLSTRELYETLIEYLGHNNLAIRGLAYWHLIRLIPEGKKLGYNPNESEENRKKVQEEWRKQWDTLIEPGKVPARPKPREKKPDEKKEDKKPEEKK